MKSPLCAAFIFALTLILLPTSYANSSPQVYYTDITSGPIEGGEDNAGSYLSLFGRGFGDDISKVQVQIAGKPVVKYKYLGGSLGRPDIQQLTVQVGKVPQGKISLIVNGKTIVTDHEFTPTRGRMIYVSLSGSDSRGKVNSVSAPFRSLQNDSGKGVWQDIAKPGDMIVLRGGEWQDRGLDNRFLRLKRNSGTALDKRGKGGPIAIIGYPGENVLIHSQKYGGIHNRGNANEAHWITLAGLRIKGGDRSVIDGPINLQWCSNHWRVVNNELFSWDAQDKDEPPFREARAGGIAGNGNNIAILGNNIHHIGGGRKNHGIYIDFHGGAKTVSDVDIGWNYVHDITGGNLIQLYGATGDIEYVTIHHNLMHNGSRFGINLGNNASKHIRIWNNVIHHTEMAGIRIDVNNPKFFEIYHNTLYQVDLSGKSGAIRNDWEMAEAIFNISNNIVYPASNSKSYALGYSGWDVAEFNNNLWFGLNQPPPKQDLNPLSTNPQFKDAANGDFTLLKGSKAIDSSMELSIPVTSDYNGCARDAKPDIGAIETLY